MKKNVGYYLFWNLVYVCSYLFFRNRKKYAFGGPGNAFKDNAKYLFIYASEHCKDIDVAWISPYHNVVNHLTSLGLKAYHWRSAKGIWHALTSRYWFYNSYPSDIGLYFSGGAKCVELWHGIGIKRIQYSIEKGIYAQPYQHPTLRDRITYAYRYHKHDYVLSSTPMMTEFFSQSFRVPKSRCLEFGYPRNAILMANEADRMAFVQRYESKELVELIGYMRRYEKVLLYMPTWRDSQRELFTQQMNLERLNEVLASKNELMILKPHPMVHVGKADRKFSNLLFLDSLMDVYPLLPYVQVLVTDYSSILYDFLLMEGKEAFLYTYDLDYYVGERDFFYPYDEYVIGNRVTTFEDFLRCVEQHDYVVDPSERQRLLQAFWGETAHFNSSQKIMEFFKDLN